MLFSVSLPASAARGSAVTSFCLNCGYKLPVHRVLLGVGRSVTPLRRRLLRLAAQSTPAGPPAREHAHGDGADQSGNAPSYSRDLRAIGQDLENLRLTTFNLECTGPSYLVWTRGETQEAKPGSRSILSNSRLRRLWSNGSALRSQGKPELVSLTPRRRVLRYRYGQQHIDRIERLAQRRRVHSGRANGHSLSQLLRSVGALIERRKETLLGIAWQESSVSVVFEDKSGGRHIDIFRPDQLYDVWVKMYLQRKSGPLLSHPS
jgi:hypothetical protein